MPSHSPHRQALHYERATPYLSSLSLPSSSSWLSRRNFWSNTRSTGTSWISQSMGTASSCQDTLNSPGKQRHEGLESTAERYKEQLHRAHPSKPAAAESLRDRWGQQEGNLQYNSTQPPMDLTPAELQLQLSQLSTMQRRQQQTPNVLLLPSGREVDINKIRGCILDMDGNRVPCPGCDGKGFVKSALEVETCPVCQQWPQAGPLRQISEYEEDSDMDLEESSAELKTWRQANTKRRTVKISAEQRAKMSAAKKGRPGMPHDEAVKRRIAMEMKKLQESLEHRRRISKSLLGKPKVCSICGQEGHNRRGCPTINEESQVQETDVEGDESRKGRTKKLRKMTFAETIALREKRREERRDRPKSQFKGLSWDLRTKRWHVQLWTGTTMKSIGYFEDEEQGARAYDAAALEVRGPDAQLNFPVAQASKPQGQRSLGRSKKTRTDAVPLPMSNNDAVEVAVSSIVEAWKAGQKRQRVEFLLPVDVDGESGGVQQEFRAARDLVEATLVRLKQIPELAGRISAQWLDKTDFVGAWQSEKLAAVIFCTADCLPQLRNIDGGDLSDRLTLVFNPQWQIDGQIISDFGFGKSRRGAEDFVRSFEDVFFMQRRRVMGDSVRLFKCYSSQWQVHYIWPNGRGQALVSAEAEPPTYERLLALLRSVPGSRSSRSWVERVLSPDWITGTGKLPAGEPESAGSSRELVVGGGGNEAALVQPAGAVRASQKELQPGLASMSASPVTSPRDPSPVDSAQSLAAAAQSDSSVLDSLRSTQPPHSGNERQDPADLEDGHAARRKASEVRDKQPDRFADGQAIRDLRLDPVMNLPQWQRQVFGNAFGRERDDSAVKKLSGLEARRAARLLAEQQKADAGKETNLKLSAEQKDVPESREQSQN